MEKDRQAEHNPAVGRYAEEDDKIHQLSDDTRLRRWLSRGP